MYSLTTLKSAVSTNIARFRFNSRIQRNTETVDQFASDLCLLAADCEYGELKDTLIRDRILIGVKSFVTQDRLLQETGLTIDRAKDIARSVEASKKQMICTATTVEVNAVHQKSKHAREPTRNEI